MLRDPKRAALDVLDTLFVPDRHLLPLRWLWGLVVGGVGLLVTGWLLSEDDEPMDLGGED